jgi:hypothetical protein
VPIATMSVISHASGWVQDQGSVAAQNRTKAALENSICIIVASKALIWRTRMLE